MDTARGGEEGTRENGLGAEKRGASPRSADSLCPAGAVWREKTKLQRPSMFSGIITSHCSSDAAAARIFSVSPLATAESNAFLHSSLSGGLVGVSREASPSLLPLALPNGSLDDPDAKRRTDE